MIFTENPVYTEHLRRMVQCATISSPNDERTDFGEFAKLHELLHEFYPLIHERMELTVIGRASLLFHLPSKNSKKKPVLLMSHQDVVPVGDAGSWTYPPFSGEIADGCIWGRGSIDCKATMLAELEAVEELLRESFAPDYDLYIALGHNEEIVNIPEVSGAGQTAKYLRELGVRLGIVIDEGGHVRAGGDGFEVAEISLAEKANVNFLLRAESEGGHSSRPGTRGTALGKIARAIVAVEKNPLPYRITPLVKSQLAATAELCPPKLKNIYTNPEEYFSRLTELAREDKNLDKLLRTTLAVTMASGSEQANVLPEIATATVNARLLQGDTVEGVKSYLESLMPNGVEVIPLAGRAPQSVPNVESRELNIVREVLRDIYGENILVIPSLMAGGTDSRFYADIADNVFRFSALYQTADYGEIHQVDERIPVNVLASGVEFFREFLRQY